MKRNKYQGLIFVYINMKIEQYCKTFSSKSCLTPLIFKHNVNTGHFNIF